MIHPHFPPTVTILDFVFQYQIGKSNTSSVEAVLVIAFNSLQVLRSKWQRNPNATPESQSASSAGSAENHFSQCLAGRHLLPAMPGQGNFKRKPFLWNPARLKPWRLKTLYEARNTQKNCFQPEKYFESQVGLQWCMEK